MNLLEPARGCLPEGPLGFPMPDRAARQLDILLRRLPSTPEHAYRHAITPRGPGELNLDERWDVSWISTESVDRTGEVVLARGMDDSQFRLNPIVTLGHNYDLPPAGISLWRRRAREGAAPNLRVGIKARTQYPGRPESWPADQPWLPDQVFALVQAGLLRGKSIGFLPLRVHAPDDREVRSRGWGDGVRLVIDDWLLLEYACVTLPANQDALVEAVAKGAVCLEEPLRQALRLDHHTIVPFTPVEEIDRAVRHQLAGRLPALVEQAVAAALDRACGRI
jgi:hypothetical protein